jgi:predicted membrane protein
MFEPEWIEYFKRESPFSYYCIIFLQFLVTILSYFSYLILLILLLTPPLMIYLGIKTIKIKLVEDKKHKKLRKEKEKQEEINHNLYFERLDKVMKKKKKH